MNSLHDALASLPVPWQHAKAQPLQQGLTNRHYQLTQVDGQQAFLRIGHPAPQALGINRALEWRHYQQAVAAGLTLPPLYADAHTGLMLLPWCDEPSWQQSAPSPHLQPIRLAKRLWQLHQLPLPSNKIDITEQCARYRVQLTHIPAWLAPLERALRPTPNSQPWRFCHHDLNPANLLGSRPWLIDWEYAGAGQLGVELAIIERSHDGAQTLRLAIEQAYLALCPRYAWPTFDSAAFLPWVDYLSLIWAMLMQQLTPAPAYQQLIALNRHRLE